MVEAASLQSGIMRSYTGRFVVDEDALRRLQGSLEKGAASLSFDTKVVFRVDREDDRFYETTEITDVISDANMPGKRVEGLLVELRRLEDIPEQKPWEEEWVVRVAFGTDAAPRRRRIRPRDLLNENAQLIVMTPDRQWALLMADDLEPQVERCISKTQASWLAYPVAIAVIAALTGVSAVLKERSFTALVQPFTIWKLIGSIPLGLFFVYMFRAMPFQIFLPDGFARWFGHDSVFLWGEELKAYPARQRFRRNILWGVVIAFLVSLVASLAVWLLTSRGGGS